LVIARHASALPVPDREGASAAVPIARRSGVDRQWAAVGRVEGKAGLPEDDQEPSAPSDPAMEAIVAARPLAGDGW
jgi:hypothetical protein